MKSLPIFPVILIVLLFVGCKTSNLKNSKETPLFLPNQNDYVIQGGTNWTFENGEIIGKSESSKDMWLLMTKKKYDDFRLTLEFLPDSTVNSGIFVRCQEVVLSAEKCYEINIWDLHPNQDFRTGSIVTKMKPKVKVETLNKWNTYTIECVQDRVRAWINGELTADYKGQELSEGFIGLQAAGIGVIRFRNVQIVSLSS